MAGDALDQRGQLRSGSKAVGLHVVLAVSKEDLLLVAALERELLLGGHFGRVKEVDSLLLLRHAVPSTTSLCRRA